MKSQKFVIEADKCDVDFEVFNAGGDVNNYTKKMIVDEIMANIPEGKVRYGENGSDPRNYRVSFKKVKEKLDFEPSFSVKDGINELVEAFRIGLFNDSVFDKNNYGNYNISR